MDTRSFEFVWRHEVRKLAIEIFDGEIKKWAKDNCQPRSCDFAHKVFSDCERSGETWLKDESDMLTHNLHEFIKKSARAHGRSKGAIITRIRDIWRY